MCTLNAKLRMSISGTLWIFLTLVLFIQVKDSTGTECNITSISSPAASSLLVKWTSYPLATSYFLNVSVVNSTTVAPVLVQLSSSLTEKLVQGLRPGHNYIVTLKVLQFYYVLCITSQRALTVPATSQITFSKAISSTSIRFQWSNASGAERYILGIDKALQPTEHHEQIFTTLSGQMNNLQPSTAYNCYIYSSNSAGLGAKSLVKTIRTLVQPPTGVTVVKVSESSARVSWLPVSTVLLYQVTASASNRPTVSWNTSTTELVIPNLVPCTTYTIGVSSISMFLEPGEPSNVTYTTPSISPVTEISSTYNCMGRSASVTWNAVFGATSYRAVAMDSQGMTYNCTSTSTTCQISMLSCGTLYTVKVIAVANCERVSNTSFIFETAPCPPANPDTYRECSSNVILYSWNATNNTAYYMATAQDTEGDVRECLTVDTSCYFTNMMCGKNYTFTVSSVYSGELNCNSGNTNPVTVVTAPCLPHNVYSTADCSVGTAVASWDPVEGAKSYVVEARGNRKDFYNCTSEGNSCMLTDLDCGESLSVWIIAKNEFCTTDPVLGEVAETVPCSPQNVSAVQTCSSNSATLSWVPSNGAVFYIGVATDASGTVHTCVSMATQCEFQGLRCGETYDAYVLATNMQCNSSDSERVTLRTAPCPPGSVAVVRDCGLNQATVSWPTLQAGGQYTAVLENANEPSQNCSTTNNTCTFPNLRCGLIYNVSVTYNNGNCSSQPTTVKQIRSAPCDPHNITSVLQCDTNVATVTWNASVGAYGYMATAYVSGQQQPLASCLTNGTSCQLTSLPCGKQLSVSVQAQDLTCNSSAPNTSTIITTAPCAPTNVTAAVNCTSKFASISWNGVLGVTGYLVEAEDTNGYRTSCNTTDTRCDLTDLRCGQEYNITVVSKGADCVSQASQPVVLTSAPCQSTGVQAMMDCRGNTALISWTPGNGTLRFSATLQSILDSHQHSCTTNSSSCNVSSLHCGERYNVSVTGYGQTCSTTSTSLLAVDTAPCVPTQVNVSMSCQSDTAAVSWTASSGAVLFYVATAEGAYAQVLTCNTSSTSCSIRGLMCGRSYNVSVTAMSANCTGERSAVYRINTGPCGPESVVSQLLDCQTGDVGVSWQPSAGALIYYAKAQSNATTILMCNSTSTSCIIPAIACGQTYNITVVAQGNGCSATSMTSQMAAGPCPPSSVSAVLSDCSTNTALVSWYPLVGPQYTARVIGAIGSSIMECNTTSSNCTIPNLICGSQLNISVTATQNNCTSTPSIVYFFRTAPCAPVLNDVILNCSRSASVMWSSSGMSADMFSVSAVSAQGGQMGCSSTNTSSCVVAGLYCDQTYTFSVNATRGHCTSAVSNTLQRQTAPCPPQNIQSVTNCGNNTVSVSWSRSNGSVSSVATLECSDGQTYICRTNAAGCDISNIPCGQTCTVKVVAEGSSCNSSIGIGPNVYTSPCEANSISATLDCVLDTATVSWQYGAGAQGYVVSVLGSLGYRTACSSNSSITHCELSSLPCGDEYVVTVQTLGNQCNTSTQMIGSLITGPCASQSLTVQYTPSMAWLHWNSTRAANFTAVAMTAEGLTASCNTFNTTCDISGLQCGQIYNISLTAQSSTCDNTAHFDPIKTEPCPPQNVRANMNCLTLNTDVTWEPSRNAVGYIASLEGQNGHSTFCRTNQTFCRLPGLTCGTVYNVKVLAMGEVFISTESAGVNMTTAPCVPANVSAVVDCSSDSALVTWSAGVGAQNYSVSAFGPGGQEVSCSSQQNSCNISSLICGELYDLTLTASNQHCEVTSANITFQSKPCAILLARVDKACGNDTAVMSWEGSEGVDYYFARAVSQGGDEKICNSTSTVCSFSNMLCGEVYVFTVTSYSGRCQSPSSPVNLTTDPCRPENVTAHVSCDSGTVRLDWSNVRGVSHYTVMATGSLGYTDSFNTSTNNLSVSLPCGQSYSVTVQGQNQDCDSPLSTPALFTLGPCAPHDIVTYVECMNNTAAVSWSSSDGANVYTATAIGDDGHTHLCVTNGTSCTWEDLHCGETYNVTVMANDSRCASPRSNFTYIHMAPCVPQAVMPVLDCGTGMARLSWASSEGAETYNVSANNGAGHTLQFSTNVTNGILTNLLCGQTYAITVRALNRQCRSALSSPANMWSVPCVPQSVVSTLDCQSNSAQVQWNISQGAESYQVVAVGTGGHTTKCNTTTSQCSLQALHCSTSYNISVIAVNEQCNTSKSLTVQTKTAPCVPVHVQSGVDCASGNVSMSWNQSVGAVSYTAVAQGNAGYASVCNSTGTACVFSNLLCGMNYSLSVSASDGTCVTEPSQPVVVNTVPCKAQNVSAQLSCNTNTAVVSWEPSDQVTSHIVRAIGPDGHRINCTSTNNSCILPSMHCGQNYNVTVTSLDGVCHSSSAFLVLQSAPCAPSSIETSLLCTSQNYGVMLVSWVQATGAQSYVAEAVSASGHSTSCNSTNTSCNLQGLQCGQIYNVSVISLVNSCQSVRSTVSQVQTAPCPPQNISTQVQCNQGSVQVSWSPAVNVNQFRVVLAAQSSGMISSCNSTGTQCSISNLPCGEQFNLSVVAVTGSCPSEPSSSLISSAPCAPQGVNGTIDCITNSAWVSWNENNAAESYTVNAVGDDGHTSNCSTTNNTCSVPDLGCGKRYTFTVSASSGICQSTPSSSFQLETAPCALSSIVVVAECLSSVIQVQWQRAQSGSTLYIATAEDQNRSLLSCNSSASSCNLTNVHCGMEYTIIVAASSNHCTGLRSPPYRISTAPCQPTSVEAHTDCQTKDVIVSWQPSIVARQYALTVVGRGGDVRTHHTADGNFTLTNLSCSNTYDVSVSASHENCTSLPSPNITFNTLPCKPDNLTLGVSCGNSSALLSWTGSVGAASYIGLAQSDDGSTIYCQSRNTSCNLHGLVCGTVYNFTVQASDGVCNSSFSDIFTGGPAPCTPTGLRAVPRQKENGTQILRASWSVGDCANSEYLLQVNGGILGNAQALYEVASYWTSRTFFEIPLPCGSSYSATIRARNLAGSSVESTAVSGTTVPCAPLDVTYSAATTVSWNASVFATNYTVYSITSSGRTRLCMTSQLSCTVGNISNVQIIATASNSAGESEDSLPVLVTSSVRRR